MKITEYNIISLFDVDEVVNQANKLIFEGWQPFGNISMAYDIEEGNMLFVQTLVKYDD
ncbi:DUF1737 domain-containing protein [Flagellimonas sp.]|uniref:DUF1737 domain-containing protein n=1 Tax=Flagellimonas sp. TaxID=2058762 RepID=UPI003BAEC916